ncbi:MAG TPA: alpha/beta hydrolase [Bdellovibrionota bacterium]|jgi:pimeloyl-ACP methyl ester carboxylesterase|nr:alpha/beta hydrolase [Bdellovibrionota bacterium]
MRGGYFHNAEGTRIAYREGGAAGGRPVLFCYGLICSAHHFRYQLEHLGRTHRTLVMDYPGHDRSDAPARLTDLTFQSLARDHGDLLDRARIGGPVHLVGHSMGVNLALEFALRYPHRVSSLILMAGAAGFAPGRSTKSALRVQALQEVLRLADGLAPRVTETAWRLQNYLPGSRAFARFMGFHPTLTTEEDLTACLDVFARFEPRVFVQLLGAYARHDVRHRLSELKVPALVIAGGRDRIVSPERVQELALALPKAELAVIKEGSHCPQLDLPHEVNSRMTAFFSRVESGAVSAPEQVRRAADRA